MRILYLSSISYPSTYANRKQTVSMVNAFAQLGVEVDLLCHKFNSNILEARVNIQEIVHSNSIVNAIVVCKFLKNKKKYELLYSRELKLLFFTLLICKVLRRQSYNKAVFEVHELSNTLLEKFFIRSLDKFEVSFITINSQLKNDLISGCSIEEKKIKVLHDAVDESYFDFNKDKESLKEELGIETSRKAVIYTGSLLPWKGVDTLIQASERLPEIDFYIVGGNAKDFSKISKKALNNVFHVEHVDSNTVIKYQFAADVLVIPNSAQHNTSLRYTSPLKLFEYMATKNSIIASNLPSIREIVDDRSAHLFVADDVSDLAKVIIKVNSSTQNKAMLSNAYLIAMQNTWKKRAQSIVKILKLI